MIIRLKTKFSEFITVITNTAFKSYKNKIIERNFVPSFIFSENQIIIVIGQDGFVKNTAKYSKNIPIVCKSRQERFDGVLLHFELYRRS
jgi:NAD kinase